MVTEKQTGNVYAMKVRSHIINFTSLFPRIKPYDPDMKAASYAKEIFSRGRPNQDQGGFASCTTLFKILRPCTTTFFNMIDNRHLVLEYMEGGDFLLLLLQKAPLKEDETCFYLAEMINGIDACHKLGFMHRDVKVTVIFISADLSRTISSSQQVGI